MSRHITAHSGKRTMPFEHDARTVPTMREVPGPRSGPKGRPASVKGRQRHGVPCRASGHSAEHLLPLSIRPHHPDGPEAESIVCRLSRGMAPVVERALVSVLWCEGSFAIHLGNSPTR